MHKKGCFYYVHGNEIMDIVRFAVFTDLHYDHIHDGKMRINNFLKDIQNTSLDFIIELGDFCYPIDKNKPLLRELQQTGVPFYCVLGNHDTDAYSREQVLNFLEMPNNYYSFIYGKIKFIVLDACYIKDEKGCKPYFKRNYDKASDYYPYLPPEEIQWIKKEFDDTNDYYVIFSHHSLVNEFASRGVFNRGEIREIINNVNNSGKHVLLCMNGHDHGDAVSKIDKTYFYTLNAMSYIWCGLREHYSYSKEIHDSYPYLKDMILYKEGFYTIVTIFGDGSFEIRGMNGHYQNITPQELGIVDLWNGVSVAPVVSALKSGK